MTEPTRPSLVEAMANMASELGETSGRILYGDRWPEVKAAQRLQAAEKAKAGRRRERMVLVLAVYLLTCLILLAPALVLLAWEAAL